MPPKAAAFAAGINIGRTAKRLPHGKKNWREKQASAAFYPETASFVLSDVPPFAGGASFFANAAF